MVNLETIFNENQFKSSSFLSIEYFRLSVERGHVLKYVSLIIGKRSVYVTVTQKLITFPATIFLNFFFYQGFPFPTLTTHKTAGKGRGPFFISLYHFHLLTNI